MKWDALWAERELSRSTGPATTVFFVNLASMGRSGGSWKGTYSELADRLGVGVAE